MPQNKEPVLKRTNPKKEGLIIKFKGSFPAQPIQNCFNQFDDEGNRVSGFPQEEKGGKFSLLLPRVSSLAKNPMLLMERENETDGDKPSYVNTNIDFSAYLGSTIRMNGAMEGNMIFLTLLVCLLVMWLETKVRHSH